MLFTLATLLFWPLMCSTTALHTQTRKLSLSTGEIDVLHDLYVSTEGSEWIWDVSVTAAPKWSFDDLNQQDPCADDTDLFNGISAWQGILCDGSPEECYGGNVDCSVVELSLAEYNVRINE